MIDLENLTIKKAREDLDKKVFSAVGVDNAEAMLTRAREHVRKTEFFCADITKEDVLQEKEKQRTQCVSGGL